MSMCVVRVHSPRLIYLYEMYSLFAFFFFFSVHRQQRELNRLLFMMLDFGLRLHNNKYPQPTSPSLPYHSYTDRREYDARRQVGQSRTAGMPSKNSSRHKKNYSTKEEKVNDAVSLVCVASGVRYSCARTNVRSI